MDYGTQKAPRTNGEQKSLPTYFDELALLVDKLKCIVSHNNKKVNKKFTAPTRRGFFVAFGIFKRYRGNALKPLKIIGQVWLS